MAVKFTPDQQKVIDIRDCNVLVSAAAGSGKTAVLVERILSMISDRLKPVDIDRLLVVTFTNAAASEMRERIHDAILKKLDEEPDDKNLQRQAVLVHHAQITTIDSFCRFILQNHFQEIDLDPGFSIGDPGKMKLMEKEAMAKVMEDSYAGKERYEGYYDDFMNLTNVYAKKGRDTEVEELVEKLYRFVMSLPFPEKWLMDSLAEYEIADQDAFFNGSYVKDIVTVVSRRLKNFAKRYRGLLAIAHEADGPGKYADLMEAEYESLVSAAETTDYITMKNAVAGIVFDKLPAVRKTDGCDEDKKNAVKNGREFVKKQLAVLKDAYFFESPEEMKEDMLIAGKNLKPLVYLTLAFMEQFSADKAKENLIDFSDMEHFALKILVDDDGNPTDVAKLYQDYYAQIMIDEYQDSNEVQEVLLRAVSKENREVPNRFMVGDMKQSIYKFRMARPELFLEKYDSYGSTGRNVRIDLKKNFRSREEVVEMVNNICYPIMGEEVGGIVYNEDAALYAGASYPEPEGRTGGEYSPFSAELLVYEKKDSKGEVSALRLAEGEAAMLVARIREMVGREFITDKITGEMRPIAYDDIVILMRSMGELSEKVQELMQKEGIPNRVPSRTGYFSAMEVQVLLKLLQVLNNPGNDIPLAAVLKSPLYGFTDEELAQIALTEVGESKNTGLYDKLCLTETKKTKAFLEELKRYRELVKTESVHDLLYRVIREHRYLEYVTALPGGATRRGNVEMLLEKAVDFEKTQMHGAFGFLQYMKQLEKYEVDYGLSGGESSGCVTIMTIHKSKGLEFPVCILAGMSKGFNTKDLSGSVLMHTDLGIGMEYRNADTGLRRNTIKQNAIAKQLRAEAMGEELRVLYVALTRAKEKLILSGTTDCLEEIRDIYDKMYADKLALPVEERKVDSEEVLNSDSYFKLLMHVFGLYQDAPEKMPRILAYRESDLVMQKMGTQFRTKLSKETFMTALAHDTSDCEALKKKIDFAYPHPELEGLYNKTSVSELKMAALHEDEQTDVMFETETEEHVVPRFMKGEVSVSGTARGTAYHRLMELLDFGAFAGVCDRNACEREYERQREIILNSGKMSRYDMDMTDTDKVVTFLQSDLAQHMACAAAGGMLYKEQPFVMTIEATRVNEAFPAEETMLIQGIIDAYYEENGKLYLLDYKTDRVNKKEDLIQRYQTQLAYYKEALEKLTGKEVAEIYIYSYHFMESVIMRL